MSRYNTGIQGGINTPGVAVQPPDFGGVQLANQLSQALGLSLNIGGQIADIAETDRQYDAQERALIARRRAEKEISDRGLGVQAAIEAEPALLDNIKRRILLVPDGTDPTEFAKATAVGEASGLSAPAAEEFVNRLAPKLDFALRNQQGQIRDEARNEDLALAGSLASRAKSREELEQIVNTKADAYPDVPRTEILRTIALQAAHTAAKDGDAERFNNAVLVLGDNFIPETMELRAFLGREIERATQEKQAELIDGFYRDMDNKSIPIQTTESRIMEAIQSGKLDASEAQPALNAIQIQKQRIEQNAIKITAQTQSMALDAAANSQLSAAAAAGQLYMVGGMENEKVTLADGSEWTFNYKKAVQRKADSDFVEIAQKAGDNQRVALAQQVDYAGRNSVVFTPWDSLLNNAASYASAASLLPTKDGKPGAARMPPQLAEAFSLYRDIKKINPTVAKTVVKNQDASKLYDMADYLMTLPRYGNNPDRAMAEAARVMANQEWWLESPPPAWGIIDKVVRSEGFDEAKNAGYVRQWLGGSQKLFAQLDGSSAQEAAEHAAQQFKLSHTLINNVWVETARQDVSNPEFIKEATPLALAIYQKHKSKDEETDDVALVGDGNGSWMLYHTDPFMQPVETLGRGQSFFTTNELRQIIEKDQTVKFGSPRFRARKAELTAFEIEQKDRARRTALAEQERSFRGESYYDSNQVRANLGGYKGLAPSPPPPSNP